MLYPDAYTKNICEISDKDIEELKKKGIKAIIFDIDNTLVPHGAPADERSKKLFKRLYDAGIRTMVLSNNDKGRVEPFARAVGTEYICKAGKPSKGGYIEACRRLGTAPLETLFAGDQIFTDIMGAKRAGLKSVLVEPVDRSTDIFKIRLKRIPESFIVKSFRKSLEKSCANS